LSARLVVRGVCSVEYARNSVDKYGCYGHISDSDITVSTCRARCSRPEDESVIRELVLRRRSFEQLDQVICAFRRDMVNQFLGELRVRPLTPMEPVVAWQFDASSPTEGSFHSCESRTPSCASSSRASCGRRSETPQKVSRNATPRRTNVSTLGDASSRGSGSPCSRSTSLTSLTEQENHADRQPAPREGGYERELFSSVVARPGHSAGPASSFSLQRPRTLRSLSDGHVHVRVCSRVSAFDAPVDLIVQKGLPPAEAMLQHRQMRACSPDASLSPACCNGNRKVKEVQDSDVIVWQAISRLELESEQIDSPASNASPLEIS